MVFGDIQTHFFILFIAEDLGPFVEASEDGFVDQTLRFEDFLNVGHGLEPKVF